MIAAPDDVWSFAGMEVMRPPKELVVWSLAGIEAVADTTDDV